MKSVTGLTAMEDINTVSNMVALDMAIRGKVAKGVIRGGGSGLAERLCM